MLRGCDRGGMITASGAMAASWSGETLTPCSITNSVSERRLASRANARLKQCPAFSISSFKTDPFSQPGRVAATPSTAWRSERNFVVELADRTPAVAAPTVVGIAAAAVAAVGAARLAAAVAAATAATTAAAADVADAAVAALQRWRAQAR